MVQSVDLPEWMDRYKAAKIAQLRALGYSQAQIADEVGVSQQTVSRYLKGIQEAADESDDVNKFFVGLLLGALGGALLAYMLSERE